MKSIIKIFKNLFGQGVKLSPEERQKLNEWQKIPKADFKKNINDMRWVVLDVETSGLNLNKDKLISIGAVSICNGEIQLNDSFEIILKQDFTSSKENILIHGIGSTAQKEGINPSEALLKFLDYLGNSPIVAFHAFFDKTMIGRAMDEFLDLNFQPTWLDLAHLGPALYPELGRRIQGLDKWMAEFGITDYARHNALSDSLATAQLFQVLIAESRKQNYKTAQEICKIEQLQRWLTQKH